MDNSTPMPEKLVQYIDGETSGAEQKAIALQLQADGELMKQYESLLATREAVRMFGLKEQVASVHRQMMEELKAPVRKMGQARRTIRYSIAVAASIILIVAGIWTYNFINLSSNKVFASNYKPYDLGTVRGPEGQMSGIEKAYRNKEYKKVTELYEANINYYANQKDQFLAAMSYVEIKNNSEAIKLHKQILSGGANTSESLLKDAAEYYLALTYIRNGDYDFALDLLRKIKDDKQHSYHKEVSAKLIRQVKLLKWR